ncbi:MAG: hypothetical protein I3274_02540 [Candidatus Moeniiplasma glomeromycotorum]|nr:hypothetical protein [Candidatus Moeniiplasma glomeromycotorum]MCE8167486.1 hypothetical protein [Candidatus Moeniiplasma glomeromycotorum]
MEEIKKRCRFCEKEHFGTQRVCRSCIERERPKLSVGWLIFWCIWGLVPGLIYYVWKKSKQEEWDRINL